MPDKVLKLTMEPMVVGQQVEVQQEVVVLGTTTVQMFQQAVVSLVAVVALGEVEPTAARPSYNSGRPGAALWSTSTCGKT